MRLQDLQDDLDRGVAAQHRKFYPTLDQVARRVADLYQECPDCEGSGTSVEEDFGGQPYGVECLRCEGHGLAATPDHDHLWHPLSLAGYLFGGEE